MARKRKDRDPNDGRRELALIEEVKRSAIHTSLLNEGLLSNRAPVTEDEIQDILSKCALDPAHSTVEPIQKDVFGKLLDRVIGELEKLDTKQNSQPRWSEDFVQYLQALLTLLSCWQELLAKQEATAIDRSQAQIFVGELRTEFAKKLMGLVLEMLPQQSGSSLDEEIAL
ncbi:MAG: hypothetical protein HZA46_22675 [Planctomycetales bacterium]|nr:hypothetical protein [Planctomycetales bacterium]